MVHVKYATQLKIRQNLKKQSQKKLLTFLKALWIVIRTMRYIFLNSRNVSLKFVSATFYQIFIFSPNDSPLKTEKCFLFPLKSSFCSRDIQIFKIFLSIPTLLRFKRAIGSGIIYDVMK